MSFLTRVLIIGAVAAGAGIAHSWVVQAGDKPIKLGVDEGSLVDTKIRRPAPEGAGTAPQTDAPEETPILPEPGDSGDVPGPELGGVIDEQSPDTDGEISLGYEILADDAYLLFDQLGAQFLDARLPEEYDTGHVQGAFFMTPEMLREGYPRALEVLSPDLPTVIYCVGGDCEASHNVAKYLQDFGFQQLHVMTDGYPAWVGAGYPTEAGAEQRLAFE